MLEWLKVYSKVTETKTNRLSRQIRREEEKNL